MHPAASFPCYALPSRLLPARLSIPTASPQVGAVSGIGIVEAVSGKRPEGATSNRAFNWLLLAKFFLGWVRMLWQDLAGCSFTPRA